MSQVYVAKEVAKLFGVNEDTVWRWIRNGALDALTLPNGRVRITQEQLDAFLADGSARKRGRRPNARS